MSGKKTTKAKSLLVAGWLVLSAVIFVSAAFDLLNLLDPEQMVESREISSVRQKFREVEDLFAAILEAKNGGGELDRVLLDLSPPSPVSESKDLSALEIEPVFLPKLSGIVAVAGEAGETRYRALLDGMAVEGGQKVDTFRVLRISQDRVVLGRDGRQWTLYRPDVPFSINQE